MTDLLGTDPLSTEALAARREHVIDVLRNARRAASRPHQLDGLLPAVEDRRVAEHLGLDASDAAQRNSNKS